MRRYKITLAIACSLFWATSCQWNSENKEKTETPAVETKSSSEKQPVKQTENLTFSKYNYFKKSHIDDNTKLPGCTIDIHISYPSGGNTGNMSLNKIQSIFVASLPDGMQKSNSPVPPSTLRKKLYRRLSSRDKTLSQKTQTPR